MTNLPMDQRDGWIWLDGEFVPWREATVHVLCHTLHYGLGVFEGVRAYETERGAAIFRLQDHTTRLFHSAKIVGIDVPCSHEQVVDIQMEILLRNELRQGYIRPMVFLGCESLGLRADDIQSHLMVAAWEWGTYLGEANMKTGIRVKTSSVIRHHPAAMMVKAKANGGYLNSILALREAIDAGYDECLMLDVQGCVCEGSGENVFLVRDGCLYTPDLYSALDGITRRTVMDLAADQGIQVRESRITRDEVFVADEVFLTGTAAEVTPVREVDGRMIGNGECGPVTERLQSTYFNLVHGKLPRHSSWLTYVDGSATERRASLG